MNRNMGNLADALQELTWAEMARVSEHIAQAANAIAQSDTGLDRDNMAEILSEMGVDIAREIEAKKSSPDSPA